MFRPRTTSTTFAALAALAMAASPAAALDLPAAPAPGKVHAAGAFDAEGVNAEGWRGHRYRHRHRDGIDAGDVLAGVLIIGGIAAIASAASGSKRDRDYRDDPRYRTGYPYRTGDDRYAYRRGDSRYAAGGGIDNAVNLCVGEIERDVRVASVDGVDRNASGWLVTGTIYNGDGFTCRIDGNGRVDGVSFGRGAANAPYSGAAVDRQWDEERYRAAWAERDLAPSGVPAAAPAADGPQPAYPGGPLPGEED